MVSPFEKRKWSHPKIHVHNKTIQLYMSISITAEANIEEVVVDKEATTTGTIDFNIPQQSRNYPLHTVFCIDKSGSMKREIDNDGISGLIKSALSSSDGGLPKIEVAKDGVQKAIKNLSSDDTFGVVAFGNSVEAEIGPISGRSGRSERKAVGDLSAGGGTNINKGLVAAKKLLEDMPNEEAIRWIVLISDGRGQIPTDSELENNFASNGITIQSAGIGGKYDRDKMLNVSQLTQGELDHIKSAKQLQEFFNEQIKNARKVAALSTKLEIVPGSDATINDVYYTLSEQQSTIDPDWTGDLCSVDLGDINSQNPPKVKLEANITASEPDLQTELFSATIRTDSDRDSDTATVMADTDQHRLEPVEDEDGQVKPEPAVDSEFVLQKISTLGQQDKLSEARNVLEENKDVLSTSEYNEAEQRLDEFASDDTGESAYKLSKLSSDLDNE